MNLIQRKQLLEAARFSSAFALSDKFLPQNILTKYLQSIKKGVLLSSNGNNSFQERVYASFSFHLSFAVNDLILFIRTS